MAKKKDKDVVSNEYDMVREQLGLPVYSYTEESPRTVELPRTEHPDISPLNDIDVSQWKAYKGAIYKQT